METYAILPIEDASRFRSNTIYSAEGFYARGQGDILEYVSYRGETTRLISGFEGIYLSDVVDGWVYFRTYPEGQLTYLWRSTLDGEQVVRLP